jgi:hypothetical protein
MKSGYEYRMADSVQIAEDAGDSMIVEGRAIVFDRPTVLYEIDG